MAQQALWSGRFSGRMDDSTLAFTSSLDVDSALARYDVMGSLAHVRMLKACNVIPADDADAIIEGLKAIDSEIEDERFPLDPELEDIHTNVEFRLTEAIGPAGGKLHTGRSRNDQVATDFRMYLRDAVLDTVEGIGDLISSLMKVAEENGNTVMPGFTHMQHAQPVTLAQHMMAHVFRLDRDADRFMDAFERLNRCPLGSAALAGTTYHINRKMTAEALGFTKPTENSMDSVSDRDFVTELSFCASMTSVHLSSLCEELVMWSSPEFGFVEMDDKYTTGSSIMPQKKNPDIAELVRGKTGGVIGGLVTMLVMTKGLPLTYNRDLQEDKAPLMSSLATVGSCVRIMSKVISTAVFYTDRMLDATTSGFINATDLADYLVTKDVPFREAHGIVGAAVRYCIESGKQLDGLSIDELQSFSHAITEDVFDILPVVRCVERRNSYGGTSPLSTDMQLSEAMEMLMIREERVRQEKLLIGKCWEALLD
jgi:argininosuccinate lyase